MKLQVNKDKENILKEAIRKKDKLTPPKKRRQKLNRQLIVSIAIMEIKLFSQINKKKLTI